MPPPRHHCGQRLSFDGQLCTVRYVGKVEGTKGDWLGVEWDDPTRGKHAGEHKGVSYFKCLSKAATPASFIRATRPHDPVRSLVDAVKSKYAPDATAAQAGYKADGSLSQDVIRISGKDVEEVGFEKIARQLADLDNLRILVLDNMNIGQGENRSQESTTTICPNAVELDLSRNLFERWHEILQIASKLRYLSTLKLDGNRLSPFEEDDIQDYDSNAIPFSKLLSLSLDDCLMDWSSIAKAASWLGQSLTSLTARKNNIRMIDRPLPDHITSLVLEGNELEALSDLAQLSTLKKLKTLSLKGNKISKISHLPLQAPLPLFPDSLSDLDLAYNQIGDWEFVDGLAKSFPGLTSLRVSGNPLYDNLKSAAGAKLTLDDGYMLTLARVAPLLNLNFSPITPKERLNAETYYLSQIGKELSLFLEEDADQTTAHHPRYADLCAKYGAPTVQRRDANIANPDSLAARLVRCNFHLASEVAQGAERRKTMDLPRSFTVYNVLGLVGRHFGQSPTLLKLIWETGEDAAVAVGDELDVGGSTTQRQQSPGSRDEALIPRTRNLGTWIDASEADIRIEWSEEDVKRHAEVRDMLKL